MSSGSTRSFDPVPALPLQEQRGQSFPRLVELMQRLLAPEGCPWDREQTLHTLRRYVLEEAYEVADAIDANDRALLCEELGDLLLQIVFQAELARTEGVFGPDDVVKGIVDKLVHRHPHVFANTDVSGSHEVVQNWERLKGAEKAGRPLLGGVPRSMPALAQAQKIGEKVARVGFDWPDRHGSRAKVAEELQELDAALEDTDKGAIEEELGDVLFAMVNLARHVGIDAEAALGRTIEKFTKRFAHVEVRVREHHGGWRLGDEGEKISLEEMDTYWEEAKTSASLAS